MKILEQIKRTPKKSDGGWKIKRKPIVTPTDNTTIPSPPDNTDKVDQTQSVKLTPKTDPSSTIWLQWTGSPQEFNDPQFVKAIEKAYINKDKRQDVY